MFAGLIRDFVVAVRVLARAPGFVVVTVTTLALGIGANAAVFSLIDGVLFRPGALRDGHELAWVTEIDGRGRERTNLSYPAFLAYRAVPSLAAVAAFDNAELSIGGGMPERVRGAVVSANYFDMLGFGLVRGRSFRATEDSAPMAHPAAIISHSLWERRYGRDPFVLDSTLRVNGQPLDIVGVAAPEVRDVVVDERLTDVWLPFSMLPLVRPSEPGLLGEGNAGWLRVLARIAPGADAERASAEAAFVARHTRRAEDSLDVRRGAIVPLRGALEPDNRAAVAPILGLVSVVPLLVLLVAGFNVVNLNIARGIARRKELAVRRALGATRARLVRQLVAESLVLAVAACAASAWIGYGYVWVIGALGDFPQFITDLLVIDVRVMVAAAGLSFLAGLGVGLIPAIAATSDVLTPALKNETIALRVGRHRHRLRDGFVVAQVAVSVVLIVTAGLFLRSLDKALGIDVGFDPRGAVIASVDLMHRPAAERHLAEQRILEAVRAIPMVTSAAIGTSVPMGRSHFVSSTRAGDNADERSGHQSFAAGVTPGYFDATGIGLVRGRDFAGDDHAGSAPVAIIDEALALRLWPGADALGRTVRFSGEAHERRVVGIAGSAYQDGLTDGAVGSIYFPAPQRPPSYAQTIVVRSPAAPEAVIAGVRAAVRAVDPDLPVFGATAYGEVIGRAASGHRAASAMLSVFGVLALVLAGVGMFGVAAHGVASRTREIGIRVSLGARAPDILRMFVGAGVAQALLGVTAGLVVSAALSRVLAGYLFGLSGTDSATFAAATLILCSAAAIASFIPARRATRVEPAVALRAE